MSVLQSGITKSLAEAYTIDQSVRLDGSGYLLRTVSASDRKTWTISCWVKRALLATEQMLIFAPSDASFPYTQFRFNSDDTLNWTGYSGSVDYQFITTQVFRDPSAWYHLVFKWDTTPSSPDSDDIGIFVNGEQVTAFSTETYPSQDHEGGINRAGGFQIARSTLYEGYLAETYFIDGTALDADSFGETDSATNQWKPLDSDDVKDAVTFGTNGFYQKYGATTANTTFTDVSSYGHTITANGGMVNSAAQVKYGSSSALFGGDGSGDYLEIADSSAFDLGTGDFTLEAWVYTTTNGSYRKIFVSGGWGVGPTGEFDYIIDKTDSGALRIQLYDDAVAPYVSTTATMSNDTWYHVAAVRSGTTFTLYIDGTASGTMTGSQNLISHGDPQIGIQTDVSATTQMWTGYIAGVRISNSARYTGNFTPSTGPYTSDANTMFLLDTWDGGLGEDSSGNNNTFTTTNLVATDQMKDSPTNNFGTWNPIVKTYGTNTFSEGNLKVLGSYAWNSIVSTFGSGSGKWYMEFKATYNPSAAYYSEIGVIGDSTARFWDGTTINPQEAEDGCLVYQSSGNKNVNGTSSSYGDAYTGEDIIGVALNIGDSEISFYKNGTVQNSGTAISFPANLISQSIKVFAGVIYNGTSYVNFGQDSSFAGTETAQGNQDENGIGDFYYPVPSGYLTPCTSNLSAPEIKLPGDNFNSIIWTGDDASPRSFTGVGFQPDFVWAKNRDDTWGSTLVDAVRGGNKIVSSDVADIENTDNNNGWIDSFDSDGFTVIAGASNADWWNNVGDDFVGWNWLGANSNSVNTEGDITGTVTVCANQTAGFSVVTYTGDNTNGVSVGHGLSEAPYFIAIKDRSAGLNWRVLQRGMVRYWDSLQLNTTASGIDDNTVWDDTMPTATVFTLGQHADVNTSGNDYVAYCFHSVEGYSKIGRYTGTGDTDKGTFVYTGFRPAWLLTKSSTATGNWVMVDAKRNAYNLVNLELLADDSAAETTANMLDFTSNGFKFRNTNDADWNGSGVVYVYLAFAEYPFKYSPAR